MRNVHKLSLAAFALAIAVSSAASAESPGQYVDDTAITTKVKAAIIADDRLKATKISVETTQGVVELSGTVDNKNQETEAINVANQVNGVRSVKDMMAVRGTQSP